jgi:hypothetical protein
MSVEKKTTGGLSTLWVRDHNKDFLNKVRKKYDLKSYSAALDKLEELLK